MFGLEKIFGSKIDFAKLKEEGAVIIDVRSLQEFESGHIPGAVNIPVEQIGAQVGKLKKMDKPIITCCRSGMRSNMAAGVLRSAGIRCENGGAWTSLAKKL